MNGQTPVTIKLGTWHSPKGDYELRLVLRRDLLGSFVAKAIKSLDGRTSVGGGLFTILAQRVAPNHHPANTNATRSAAP